MRLIAIALAALLALGSVGPGYGQSFDGYTAVMRIRAIFFETEGRIYITRNTIFARFGEAEGGGYVCPLRGSETIKATCTEDAIASCAGPFLDLQIVGNIRTTNTSTCSGSKPTPGEYCATIEFVEDSQQRRKSYHATGTTVGCLTIEADGTCSFIGRQEIQYDNSRQNTARYRSAFCELVEGRHL